MTKRDRERLIRRTQRAAESLGFISALTSPVAVREMLRNASPGAIQSECRRAVAVWLRLVPRVAAGASGEAPLDAEEPLRRLGEHLKQGDLVALGRDAAAALKAMGCRVPPHRQSDRAVRRSLSASKQAGPLTSKSAGRKKRRGSMGSR